MKPKLDVKKIKKMLIAIDRTASWLSRQSGVGRQWVHYDLKSGCLLRVELYAKALGLEAKSLIVFK